MLTFVVTFLSPANEVCEGNVFTGGLSVHKGVSVQGRGVFVQGWGGLCPEKGGLCPGGVWQGGSLSGGLSVQGGLCQGNPPPYGYVRAVRILLDCILVVILSH